MFGLVGRKRHEAEIAELHRSADRERDRLNDALRTTAQNHQQALRSIASLNATLKNLDTRVAEANDARLLADQRCKVAEAECARITACHATRVRIGWIPIDAIEMTARVRAVEGSLRCEWDGSKIVCYGDRMLSEAEFNAVVAVMMPQLNRT